MSEHLLSVQKREGIGRGNSRRLRAQGLIPAVIYGKSGNRNLAVGERDFQMLMRELAGGASVITLKDNDNDSIDALIHDYQRDPLTDRFKHIDFLEVVKGQKISATIPVQLIGESKGVKNGGLLEFTAHEIHVHCLPKDLPEHIEVDISDLDIGDSVHLGQVKMPEGVHADADADQTIVHIGTPQKVESTTPAEGEEAAEGAKEDEGEK